MKRPAVFFDRDNTLIVTDGYLASPSEVTLVDGAADAVASVRRLGYAAIIFSNQSGVARGMYSEEAVHAVNGRLDEMLLDQNPAAVIDRHEFCPYHPEASEERYRVDSDLRKPKPGMIYQAAEKLALDLDRSWVIGDAPRDIEAGHAAGCRTILFRDPKLSPSPAASEPTTVLPDYTVATLEEATRIIAQHPVSAAEAPVEDAAGIVPMTDAAGRGTEFRPVVARAADVSQRTTQDPHPNPLPAYREREISESAALPAYREREISEPAPLPTHREGEMGQPAPLPTHREREMSQPAALPTHGEGEMGKPAAPPAQREREMGQTAAATVAASQEKETEKAAPAAPAAVPGSNFSRLEMLSEQMLQEMRRSSTQTHPDFSVSKLLAGVVQIIALAALVFAYIHRDDSSLVPTLLVANFLQTFTISLLIMGRQR